MSGRAGYEGSGFDKDPDELDDVFGTGFEDLSDDDEGGTGEEAERELHAKVRELLLSYVCAGTVQSKNTLSRLESLVSLNPTGSPRNLTALG